jgi:NADH:ubiquinone oxidoreductase subunit 5 (subunit L)/multisubunit Na+/H+ antiporter MnhA subunit
MTSQTLLVISVVIPVAGSVATALAALWSARARNAIALLSVSLACVASAALVNTVWRGNVASFSISFPLGCDLSFAADGLAVFMAVVSSLISAVVVLYSFDYIRHYEHQTEYYSMVALFLGSMMGLVYSSNLISLYVFWELTAIASWRLIGFFREPRYVLRADKAFLVTAFGALSMFLGFLMLYDKAGSFELSSIKSVFAVRAVPAAAVALILAGILSKSATLPFHTWLPDAGVAPSPVTALLHAAVLVKIGVYAFARIFVATIPLAQVWHTVVPAIAAASALVSAGAALVENDMKRIIAYSTISQIAFIFLGLSVGIWTGVYGALLFILMHGLAKGGLFLCAGIIEHNTHNKNIRRMGGLASTMPITAMSFAACSLSVMGIPPFGGFFSKYFVFSGAAQSGHTAITLVFLVGAVMTILYLFRLFNMIFLGDARGALAREGSAIMVVSVAALAVMSLAAGIFIYFPASFAERIVRYMAGSL